MLSLISISLLFGLNTLGVYGGCGVLQQGVVNDYPESTLIANGFTTCYDEAYSHWTRMQNIYQLCPVDSDTYWFVGGKDSNSATSVRTGAFVLSTDVAQTIGQSGSNTLTGAPSNPTSYWYNVDDYSFGFSADPNVRLTSCDTYDVSNNPRDNHRLCWHTHSFQVGGWRVGSVTSLNGNNVYRKVLWYCSGTPTNEPTPAPTDNPTNAPTASPTWYPACTNDPCDCNTEDPHCEICHENGCDECELGPNDENGYYWKLDYNYPCTECHSLFGNECLFCQDFNGCGQCDTGYFRVYDAQEDLYHCENCQHSFGNGCNICFEEQGCTQCDNGNLVLMSDNRYHCVPAPPTPSPTPSPTHGDTCNFNIQECASNNCAGDGENPHCSQQNTWGCSSCNNGYFMKNHQTPCLPCSAINGCTDCQDWNGCTQCDNGYSYYWDINCNLGLCQAN